MATIYEDLSGQVNGITDTFITASDISEGVVIDYNGQVVNKLDITILTPTSFKLAFIPKAGSLQDTLAAFISPDQFNITDQVDGVRTDFIPSISDTGQGDFIAILNGQILAQDTRQLENGFRLLPAPIIGDELEYIRVQILTIVCVTVNAMASRIDAMGKVGQLNNVFGILEPRMAFGKVTELKTINGKCSKQIDIKGFIHDRV